jgi:prephenate dehydrogenase
MGEVAEPPFSSIAVVGLGLIGGSIALGVRKRWPASRVFAVDRPSVLAHAAGSGAVDRTFGDIASLPDADLIVLAAPVRANIQLLQDVGKAFAGRSHVIVTDVGGTKQDIVAAASALPASITFVGGHPLGGAERGGFAFATPLLFSGRPWIFTPDQLQDSFLQALDRLTRLVIGLGARPSTLTPRDHDRLMAFLSHLPQVTVSALMDVVGSAVSEKELSLAGQGLLDTTRLASSPASVWKDICATNAEAIGPALDALIARLSEIRNHLQQEEAVGTLFDNAARCRAALMKGRD